MEPDKHRGEGHAAIMTGSKPMDFEPYCLVNADLRG